MSVKQKLDGKPWYHDIKPYITCREYPLGASSKNSRCAIRKLAMSFFFLVLYKRNYDISFKMCGCLRSQDTFRRSSWGSLQNTCKWTHDGKKIFVYRLLLVDNGSDCIKYARKCHKCQRYANKIHAPASLLHVLTTMWPFSLWWMDVIEPIESNASNGDWFW